MAKILYVDLEYDYGIISRGKNIIGQFGFLDSFFKLGYEVDSFYYDEYLDNRISLNQNLLIAVEDSRPDIVFFNLFKDQIEIETLELIKRKTITVNWFGDDHWRFDNFTYKYCNHFTWCITTDLFSIEKYNQLDQQNVIYSQWGAIETNKTIGNNFYKYDVSFIGEYHPYRKWFIDKLRKSGINIEAFGSGWTNGRVSLQEMNTIFSQSKININIENSNSLDIRYLLSSPMSLIKVIRSNKNASQIKARNFEIPFNKGFQLTNYVPTLENYFSIGYEIACYSSIQDAINQIKYYLINKEIRENIKNNGYQKAKAEHCYLQRLKLILEQVNEKNSNSL